MWQLSKDMAATSALTSLTRKTATVNFGSMLLFSWRQSIGRYVTVRMRVLIRAWLLFYLIFFRRTNTNDHAWDRFSFLLISETTRRKTHSKTKKILLIIKNNQYFLRKNILFFSILVKFYYFAFLHCIYILNTASKYRLFVDHFLMLNNYEIF